MKLIHAILLASVLPLSTATIVGCATIPSASDTRADEQTVLAVETGYQAASAGLRLASDAGLLKDPTTRAHYRDLNHKAFHAVCLTRIAYNFANHAPASTNLQGACMEVVSEEEMAKAVGLQEEADLAVSLIGQLAELARGVN